jgi:hypothetical protein
MGSVHAGVRPDRRCRLLLDLRQKRLGLRGQSILVAVAETKLWAVRLDTNLCGCGHAVSHGLIALARDPQPMQEHAQFTRHGDDSSFLGGAATLRHDS